MTKSQILVASVIAGVILFGTGYLLGGRGSAALRAAYQDTVSQNRVRAHVADSLAQAQRTVDLIRVAAAERAADEARVNSTQSGVALPGQLPVVPPTVVVMDTAQVKQLRQELAAFAQSLALHLHDDTVMIRNQETLVRDLRRAEVNALAAAVEARAERDRVTNQLAGATQHLTSGHSVFVDVAIAGLGVVAGYVIHP